MSPTAAPVPPEGGMPAWQWRRAVADSNLLEAAADTRGVALTRLDEATVVLTEGDRRLLFTGLQGPGCSVGARALCDDKLRTRRLLAAAGLPTPLARGFAARDVDAGWRFADVLIAPVAIKPLALEHGFGVHTRLVDEAAFRAAWQDTKRWKRRRHPGTVVVEEHVEGEDLRCFVVGGAMVAAVQRRSPRVHGDGQRTVAELIAADNRARADHPLLAAHPIPTDLARLEQLTDAGLSLDTVPADGATVVLSAATTLAAGADLVDVTEVCHPGFARRAVRALEAIPGLTYGAVDILTASFTDPPSDTPHVVAEVEFAPVPFAEHPNIGQPRDLSGAILDAELAQPAG